MNRKAMIYVKQTWVVYDKTVLKNFYTKFHNTNIQ